MRRQRNEDSGAAAPLLGATLRELRADALHRVLLSRGGQVATLGDIARLPALAGWSPARLEVAIGDLVHQGLLVDDEYGRPQALPTQQADPETTQRLAVVAARLRRRGGIG